MLVVDRVRHRSALKVCLAPNAPVCSKAEALDYFRFGSAGSFFLYDKNTRHFSRYWDSD